MNTNDMLAILAELFDSFSFHELFLEELGSLLKKDLKGKKIVSLKCYLLN